MNFWQTFSKAAIDEARHWRTTREVYNKSRGNHYYVDIPAFEINNIPACDASYIATEFRLNSNVGFSIPRLPLIKPTGVNFCLAVRFPQISNTGLDVIRYKLWSDIGELLCFPQYAGERIGASAVFEIWSLVNNNVVSLAVPYRIYLSIKNTPLLINSCCETGDNGIPLIQVCELFANKNDVGSYNLPLLFNYCINEIPPTDEKGIITEDASGKISTEDQSGVITENQ